MIALFNFNNYLGGGETIFTRWAEYLSNKGHDFRLFYPSKSFIADEVKRLGIKDRYLCPYEGDVDYYYQTRSERLKFINYLWNQLATIDNVKLVSFCLRDLYTLIDLAKKNESYTVTHLILHDEDNKYVCQTLYDKLTLKLGGKRQFSNKKQLAFNNQLLRSLIDAKGLIAEKMTTKIVMSYYDIDISEDIIVPPPMCEFQENVPNVENNKRIIWVGRIVDFKIPAICAMLDFVCCHKDYCFTIIGDGEINFLKQYMSEHHLDGSNVFFRGIVSYNEIADIIKEHSIGYACGTSIVEIGQHGLPVITALASPTHRLFSRSICGGIYNNKYKGNEGNNLFIGETENEQPTIEETMSQIESDFGGAACQSYMAMKADFDLNQNIDNYHRIIEGSRRLNVESIEIPNSSFLRRLIYKYC